MANNGLITLTSLREHLVLKLHQLFEREEVALFLLTLVLILLIIACNFFVQLCEYLWEALLIFEDEARPIFICGSICHEKELG